jgi:hypothetical protein
MQARGQVGEGTSLITRKYAGSNPAELTREWRNGRRAGLRCRWGESPVWVRSPPYARAPVAQRTGQRSPTSHSEGSSPSGCTTPVRQPWSCAPFVRGSQTVRLRPPARSSRVNRVQHRPREAALRGSRPCRGCTVQHLPVMPLWSGARFVSGRKRVRLPPPAPSFDVRASSSVDRAPASGAGGPRFEPGEAHDAGVTQWQSIGLPHRVRRFDSGHPLDVRPRPPGCRGSAPDPYPHPRGVRPIGVARSARHVLTVEIAGSSPAWATERSHSPA